MSKAGASHGAGPAMPSGERRKSIHRAVEVAEEDIDRRPQIEHECRIDEVTAACAEVYIGHGRRVGLCHVRGKSLEHRSSGIAADLCFFAQRIEVVVLRARRIGNDIDCESRNNAESGLCPRERNFEIEHALEARTITESFAHARA
jgi:hypothetical protein